MKTIKAKFRVESIQLMGSDRYNNHSRKVVARPVTSDSEENKTYSKWTPTGLLELTITNPDVFDWFKPDQEFTMDIHLGD